MATVRLGSYPGGMLDLRGAVTIATALSSNRAWELVGATLDGRRRPSAHHHEKMDADVSFRTLLLRAH